MKTWHVFLAGSFIGTVQAMTAPAALRKARYEWGSSSDLTDAQLRKMTVKKANPSKRSTAKRVSSALKKWLKGQTKGNPSMKPPYYRIELENGLVRYAKTWNTAEKMVNRFKRRGLSGGTVVYVNAQGQKSSVDHWYKENPAVRKVKGGRAVSLRNFSGTVVRKSNGQVVIQGKALKASEGR